MLNAFTQLQNGGIYKLPMDKVKLFIGLACTDDVRRQLSQVSEKIRLVDPEARIIPKENFHLTLAFIGDVPRSKIDVIKKSLPKTVKENESWLITQVGSFHRHDLIFASGKSTPYLDELCKEVRLALSGAGIRFDGNSFKPHISLARKTTFAGKIEFEPILMAILPPVLYESRQDNRGRRIYIPV